MATLMSSKQTSVNVTASKIKHKNLSESALVFDHTGKSMSYKLNYHPGSFVALSRGLRDRDELTFRCVVSSSHDHARHLLLLQGLAEDQQQGLGSRPAGPEGEEPAAADGGRAPPETSEGSVLRSGHQELQA